MRSPRLPVPPRHDASGVVAASRVPSIAFALLLSMAALIHLMPLLGLFGSDGLQRLYDLRFDEPNALVLMRHRAVLFGLLGSGLLLAIPYRAWRAPMLGAGLVSTLAFLVLALATPGINAALQRVLAADIVAFVALLLAALIEFRRVRDR